MSKVRRMHAVCKGPLGFPLREAVARKVEALLETQPKGPEWEYRRTGSAPTALELVEGERCDVSVISTPTLDRDREIVVASGIDLTQFRANPVVTFAHRYDELPVGRALWIKHEGDRLKAKTRYSPRPPEWKGDWLPDAVWHMVKNGDLNGKSIGFLPLEGGPPTAEEIDRNPTWKAAKWVYRKSLLLEYAVAPLQSNPDALVESVSKVMARQHRFLPLAALSESFEEALARELTVRELELKALERIERRLGRV